MQSLRYIGAILVLLAFTAQTFSRMFIVADYYANTSAYARNCENKAKPKLHCNGKCQMMKKLKQEENRDKQNPERKSENKDEVLYSKSFFASLHFTCIHLQKKYPLLKGGKTSDMPRSLFHPPGIIV